MRSGWVGLDCPFCGSGGEGKFYLGYNTRHHFCTCWRCGPHRLSVVLEAVLGMSRSDARRFAAGLAPEHVKREERVRGRMAEPRGVGPFWRQHKKYIRSRGFSPKTLEIIWKVRGIGLAPRLAWRLYVPVFQNGLAVSWTTRSLSDDMAGHRYVSASPEEEAVPITECLYGMDLARNVIVVHEGPTDAWATGPGAVSTLGIKYGRRQVKKIASFPVRGICFDAEPQAQARARELCDDLAPFPGETYLLELESGDPATASRKDRDRLRAFLETGS